MINHVKLGIVGYRGYTNYEDFSYIVDDYINGLDYAILTIVSGGAKGVDSLAAKYAKDNKLQLQIFEAKWDKYGDEAGPMRNAFIVNESTHILALPAKNSIGTYDTIRKAKGKGRNITVIPI